jgi:hypothetical protein
VIFGPAETAIAKGSENRCWASRCRAGLTVTFGNPWRIRDILPDHEFRGAEGRGSGVILLATATAIV